MSVRVTEKLIATKIFGNMYCIILNELWVKPVALVPT